MSVNGYPYTVLCLGAKVVDTDFNDFTWNKHLVCIHIGTIASRETSVILSKLALIETVWYDSSDSKGQGVVDLDHSYD